MEDILEAELRTIHHRSSAEKSSDRQSAERARRDANYADRELYGSSASISAQRQRNERAYGSDGRQGTTDDGEGDLDYRERLELGSSIAASAYRQKLERAANDSDYRMRAFGPSATAGGVLGALDKFNSRTASGVQEQLDAEGQEIASFQAATSLLNSDSDEVSREEWISIQDSALVGTGAKAHNPEIFGGGSSEAFSAGDKDQGGELAAVFDRLAMIESQITHAAVLDTA